jgi:hypothetical protein
MTRSPRTTLVAGALVLALATVAADPAVAAPLRPTAAAAAVGAPAGPPERAASLSYRPVACGTTFNRRFAIHVTRRTGCTLGRAAYRALRAYDRSPDGGFVAGSPKRFPLEIVVPGRARPVPVQGRAVVRAHGEFDFTFINRARGISIRYDNLTLP